MNPRARDVQSNQDYSLTLTFENGEIRVFDVSPYLEKGLFQQLKNRALSNSARSLLGSIRWSNGLDLCPDILYLDSVRPTSLSSEEPGTGIHEAA
jgi:hypothetical protein